MERICSNSFIRGIKKKIVIVTAAFLFLVSGFFLENTDTSNHPEILPDDSKTSVEIQDNGGIEEAISVESEQPKAEGNAGSNLSVHFIDVGQGDATLFICDGEAMLLDAGNTSSGTSIQLYLKKRGISTLKYLILTHPDEDHIGGADVIVTKYNIDNVFMPSLEKDTTAFAELMDALEYRRYKWSTPNVGDIYTLGSATITIIAPNRSYSEVNEASIGILVTHGSNKLLLTGDAEGEAEKDIVNNGINIDCDVFKAGHHGSRNSNSIDLLRAASPEYVIVSCGAENSYGHPHAGPMNDFKSMGMKLFRTDEQGTIVVDSDGTNLVWNMSPTDNWGAGKSTQDSSELKSDSSPTLAAVTETGKIIEPETYQQAASNFAVNGRNGKVHIVGACAATGSGKNAMKQPVYFATFEEAEEYSIQYFPELDERKCGSCYE